MARVCVTRTGGRRNVPDTFEEKGEVARADHEDCPAHALWNNENAKKKTKNERSLSVT